MTREEFMALVHLTYPGAKLHEVTMKGYSWAAIYTDKTIFGGAYNRKYICLVQPEEHMSAENVFQLLCAKYLARKPR